MKLLAKNQIVGNGQGFTLIRDLFEDDYGKRISVPKSQWHQETKKLKNISAEKRIELFPLK